MVDGVRVFVRQSGAVDHRFHLIIDGCGRLPDPTIRDTSSEGIFP
jgi:hypothetical protein